MSYDFIFSLLQYYYINIIYNDAKSKKMNCRPVPWCHSRGIAQTNL